MNYLTADQLKDDAGAHMNVIDVMDEAVLTAQIEERSQGIVLWRWCVILALVFVAVEVLLLRFWRV